jgi:type V secretory pathway adhesin AidA
MLSGSANRESGSTSNLSLMDGTVWMVTNNSNITNLANTSSTIELAPPIGGAFKSLTTVNYAGADGTIGLNTFLGADGSPSDLLVVNGGTATGSTNLRITNAGGPGAYTTANGILVVDAVNGGATANDAFTLAGETRRFPQLPSIPKRL